MNKMGSSHVNTRVLNSLQVTFFATFPALIERGEEAFSSYLLSRSNFASIVTKYLARKEDRKESF